MPRLIGPEYEIYTQTTPLNTYADVSSQKFGLSFHIHYFFVYASGDFAQSPAPSSLENAIGTKIVYTDTF